jgi:hypothetical protein
VNTSAVDKHDQLTHAGITNCLHATAFTSIAGHGLAACGEI